VLLRALIVGIIALCLVVGGFFAATFSTNDTEAETTWQYEVFRHADEFEPFLAGLPSSCSVEFDTLKLNSGDLLFMVAYSCP
jgi:hypothetical protein